MSGVEDPNVIDILTHDPNTGEYALIMVETRPWENSPEQLAQLRDKINNYANFCLDEGLILKYPQVAGKPIRIQLDCPEEPTGEAAELVALARQRLDYYRIRFVVNVLD